MTGKFAGYKKYITFASALQKYYTQVIAGNGLWCNGNTADFGSVVLGSSPSRPTKSPLI